MANNKNPWEDDAPHSNNSKTEKSPKVKNISDYKKGNNNNNFFEFEWKIKWVVFALLAIWLASGFYQIEPNEQGVVLQFGKYKTTTESGLRYHLPFPIETVIKVNQTQERSFTLGDSNSSSYGYSNSYNKTRARYNSSTGNGGSYDNFTESHMLTGDESIVDINLAVVWKIKNSKDYLFSLREPDQTVYAASQSVLREIVGQSQMMEIITGDRGKVEEDTKRELQALLDDYGSGIEITRVQLQKAEPPTQVVDAFNDVQRARNDRDRYQKEADAYYNDVVPKAEGQAIEILNSAKAYKEKVMNEASGESKRFQSIYTAYKQGRDVTATRLYMETMEDVLNKTNLTIVDPSSKGQNVLPVLQVK